MCFCVFYIVCFFCKQKTAYEMRISDWSSDVCSSDLPISRLVAVLRTRRWARMGLTTLSIGLLVAAVGTIGYPFYTNLYQQRVQERLDRQIASPEQIGRAHV